MNALIFLEELKKLYNMTLSKVFAWWYLLTNVMTARKKATGVTFALI